MDIEYLDSAPMSKAQGIRDTYTGEVLGWNLTKAEIAALEAGADSTVDGTVEGGA